MLKRILALIRKEFLALFQDKRSRLVVIVPPVVQLIVFGYAATYDLNNVDFAVFNEDRGALSRAFLARLRGSTVFREGTPIRSQDEIARRIDSRSEMLVVHISPQFSEDLLNGNTASVQVIVDGRDSNTASLVLGYLRSILDEFNRDWINERNLRTLPATLVPRFWFNPNLESRWFFIPGLVGLLTLVVTILVTALSVAREREQGTFDQLLVTPLRPAELLIGKAVPGFLIGLFEATLIITVAGLWFRVPLLGSFLTLYVGIALFLLSGIGVGIMISSMAVTQQQGLLGAFLFLVPAIILSGFATPIDNMPESIQYLTYLNPARYFMIIVRGVFLQGSSFTILVHQFWPMAAIGICALSLAGWLFRHRLY